MNFEFSEEQTMIKDSVSRFVREQYDFDTRRGIIESDDGISREFWSMFAELGWLSVPFAEEYGGFGGTVVDIAAVMEEMGKGIVVEPYSSTVVVFGGLLSASTNSALKEQVIPSIIEGTCLGSFAYMEPQSRYEMSDVSTAATASGKGYTLNGVKTVVANGGTANKFIVSARTSGEQFDPSGVSLFMLDAATPGVEVKAYKMMDGQSAATLTLTDVAVDQSQLLNAAGEGMGLIESGHAANLNRFICRSSGHYGNAQYVDRRVLQDSPAVWRTHWLLPSATAPNGRHLYGLRTDQVYALSGSL